MPGNRLRSVTREELLDVRPELVEYIGLRHGAQSGKGIFHGAGNGLIAVRDVSVGNRSLGELAQDDGSVDHVSAAVAAANEHAAGGIGQAVRNSILVRTEIAGILVQQSWE